MIPETRCSRQARNARFLRWRSYACRLAPLSAGHTDPRGDLCPRMKIGGRQKPHRVRRCPSWHRWQAMIVTPEVCPVATGCPPPSATGWKRPWEAGRMHLRSLPWRAGLRASGAPPGSSCAPSRLTGAPLLAGMTSACPRPGCGAPSRSWRKSASLLGMSPIRGSDTSARLRACIVGRSCSGSARSTASPSRRPMPAPRRLLEPRRPLGAQSRDPSRYEPWRPPFQSSGQGPRLSSPKSKPQAEAG